HLFAATTPRFKLQRTFLDTKNRVGGDVGRHRHTSKNGIFGYFSPGPRVRGAQQGVFTAVHDLADLVGLPGFTLPSRTKKAVLGTVSNSTASHVCTVPYSIWRSNQRRILRR